VAVANRAAAEHSTLDHHGPDSAAKSIKEAQDEPSDTIEDIDIEEGDLNGECSLDFDDGDDGRPSLPSHQIS
jgi:hypothetical protein